jgi:hypothetical protein
MEIAPINHGRLARQELVISVDESSPGWWRSPNHRIV